MSTEDVLNHHLAGFGAGDVDEVMMDYTDDSVLIVPDATLTGLDAIRGFFTDGFNGLFSPGTFEFTMDRMEISGDVAFILWHTSGDSVDIRLGTDTFLVRDGKIALQTFAALVEEK